MFGPTMDAADAWLLLCCASCAGCSCGLMLLAILLCPCGAFLPPLRPHQMPGVAAARGGWFASTIFDVSFFAFFVFALVTGYGGWVFLGLGLFFPLLYFSLGMA